MEEETADSSYEQARPLAAAVATRALSPTPQDMKATPESQGGGGTDRTEGAPPSERSRSDRGGTAARRLEFGGPPKRGPQPTTKAMAATTGTGNAAPGVDHNGVAKA